MRLYLLLINLLIGACSTLPPAFEDDRIKEISYAQVSENAQSYNNTLVKWGGVITEVNNEGNSNLMQVLYYPLDYYGRPEIAKPNEGYFIVKSPETLDPKDYPAGREVVVVGVIEGKTEPTEPTEPYASSANERLPLISANAVYLWPIAYRDNYYRYCPSCYFRQLFW